MHDILRREQETDMRKRHAIAFAVSALVAGLALGSIGLAAAASNSSGGSSSAPTLPAGSVPPTGTPGVHGPGGPGGAGGPGGGSDLVRVVAKLTGESTSTVQKARETTGTSFASIAAKKDVTVDQVVTLAMASHKAAIESELSNGLLTDTEATQQLVQLKEHITADVNSTQALRGPGRGPGGPGAGAPPNGSKPPSGGKAPTGSAPPAGSAPSSMTPPPGPPPSGN
jgi:hypothetical protein